MNGVHKDNHFDAKSLKNHYQSAIISHGYLGNNL